MADFGWISEYNAQINDGRIIAGKYIRLLYKYLVAGLEGERFFYDEEKATKAVEWIETHCFHTEGPLAPGPIQLELWQKALIAAMFGIVDSGGLRQFKEVLLVVARKNGKSKLASCVADYMWRECGGYGTRVYCIAPKLDQADIIYNDVWQMVTLDPEWQALRDEVKTTDKFGRLTQDDSMLPRHRQSDLAIPGTNSTVKKIASNAKKSDGFNPSLSLMDEIASWEGDKGLKQYEVMKSAMGARPEGLLLSCTTSGYVNDSIYDELVKRATRFLLGDSKETKLLPFLYMIDDIESWYDLNELRKSNPNLGVSVSESFMAEEVAIAEGSLSKKAEFMTKYCCIKQNSSLAWLDSATIEAACGEPLSLEDFRGSYCVGGVDLSRTTDLTAATAVIEKDGELYVFAKFWLPSERILEAQQLDGVPYEIYRQRGLLDGSGDNFVDYRDVFDWFRRLVEEYGIYPLQVGYDKYSAAYLVQEMKGYGFHMDDVFQGYNLYPVIQELEGLMKDGRVHIGDNDLLKIHLYNAAVKINAERGRGKLAKINPTGHVDGVSCLLDALTVRQKWFGEIGDQLKNN